MLSHMAFLYQFNSHHNEPIYYYRMSFTFFCSEFAAYIRRNTVSYGFYDKIFMLNQGHRKNKSFFRQFAYPRMIYLQIEKQILQDAWGSQIPLRQF